VVAMRRVVVQEPQGDWRLLRAAAAAAGEDGDCGMLWMGDSMERLILIVVEYSTLLYFLRRAIVSHHPRSLDLEGDFQTRFGKRFQRISWKSLQMVISKKFLESAFQTQVGKRNQK